MARITNRWTGATGSAFRIKRDPAKLLGSAVARSTPPLGIFLDMRIFRPWVSNEWMIKWSPAFLLASIFLLFISLLFGPFSPTFFLSSIIFGLIYTVLTLTYWKWESKPLSLIILLIDVVVVAGGWGFTMRRAFPEARYIYSSWMPVQYLSVIFTTLFAI